MVARGADLPAILVQSRPPEHAPRRHDEDREREVEGLRDDIATLARLVKEIGEGTAGETRDKAPAEAAGLLDRSRKAVEEGRRPAREKGATIVDCIHDKPCSPPWPRSVSACSSA